MSEKECASNRLVMAAVVEMIRHAQEYGDTELVSAVMDALDDEIGVIRDRLQAEIDDNRQRAESAEKRRVEQYDYLVRMMRKCGLETDKTGDLTSYGFDVLAAMFADSVQAATKQLATERARHANMAAEFEKIAAGTHERYVMRCDVEPAPAPPAEEGERYRLVHIQSSSSPWQIEQCTGRYNGWREWSRIAGFEQESTAQAVLAYLQGQSPEHARIRELEAELWDIASDCVCDCCARVRELAKHLESAAPSAPLAKPEPADTFVTIDRKRYRREAVARLPKKGEKFECASHANCIRTASCDYERNKEHILHEITDEPEPEKGKAELRCPECGHWLGNLSRRQRGPKETTVAIQPHGEPEHPNSQAQTGAIMKPLIILLLLCGSAHAQSITVQRDGQNICPPFALSADPVEAGQEIRQVFDLVRDKRPDTVIAAGTADFGHTHTVDLPNARYVSDPKNPARWLTHCKIDFTVVDGVRTKESSTCGFSVREFARFENFHLGGDCWDVNEDGGLIGFHPEHTGPGVLQFKGCDIDGSHADWCIYGWRNAPRTVTIEGGTLRFCRFGVALAASGAGAQQTVILDGVRLLGDANGSKSIGESSGGNVESGGVLTAVLNRLGTTTLRDCRGDFVGLKEPYNSKWGCPRIAALATNNYYSSSGATSFVLERNRVNIVPGISQAWYDADVRGSGKLSIVYNDQAIQAAESAGAKLVAEARGGSGENGELKVWKP